MSSKIEYDPKLRRESLYLYFLRPYTVRMYEIYGVRSISAKDFYTPPVLQGCIDTCGRGITTICRTSNSMQLVVEI